MATPLSGLRARHVVARRVTAVATAILLLAALAPVALAAAPANDLVAGAIPLTAEVPVDFDSTDATMSATDPTDCNGSHGPFPGPYFASVWFSYTATANGQISLSSPTTQGTDNDFLAISFVYLKTASGLTLVDCTAFGNDASWATKKGQTFLIMEAGLSSDVTDYPPLSDRGGHGTIVVTRSPPSHYHYVDFWSNEDCGFTINGRFENNGQFRLRPGKHDDSTPYYFDNYEWHQVVTNPANGKWFREDGQGLYRDLHITNVEGTVYTFVSQETGRPYTLTDMDGNRIFFDRGRLLTTFQVDTKGDDQLWNDEFIEGSWQLLDENGSHPMFFFDGDFCDIVRELIG
jgi:hypothetical protein